VLRAYAERVVGRLIEYWRAVDRAWRGEHAAAEAAE
jgi:hypothetical protein